MQLSIIKPDDWHLHLRDGEMLSRVVQHTTRQFSRALVMPNLRPPITKVSSALDYRKRIKSCVPDSKFEPYMALYLTDNTAVTEVRQAAAFPYIPSFKLYPKGATTNSDSGVTNIKNIMPILEAMAQFKVALCVHGEDTNPKVDVFDREAVFIDNTLAFIHKNIPELKIVLEHISSKQGIQFVQNSKNIAGSITCHHLMDNRNAMFIDGLRPHNYCLPVLKREEHREEIVKAATSGNSKFFAGTDSAPHGKHKKEASCGCAGVYTAHAAVELYTEVFDKTDKLDQLENFLSINGANFYGLEPNTEKINLEKKDWTVPKEYFSDVVPYRAGKRLKWKLL